ncbi:protein-tyrosine phosphatase family protein [Tautonia plasticadhaerens]|uniref:Tyrosine specific protein phosphatases domain-containing protein n=1 Tax=Tautonia plasticadhaerens TaxID=2527974 RepID=A0A518H6N1_9BACT|nr:protein tyrosine phosphatase [Tautonia plasticadhaerens]QDV36465.1 hypothetical protein ElP_43910 [Tautonia plasticadhaerens]
MPPSNAPESPGPARSLRDRWPWTVLAVALVPAIWHAVAFPGGPDGEFPGVARPTFSPAPPAAYRLAEPGDTLDRVGLYLCAASLAVAGYGVVRRKASGKAGVLWISALGLEIAGFWYAANPWPTFDGWHGLGWRVVADSEAPMGLRIGLGAAAAVVLGMVAAPIARLRRAVPLLILRGRRAGVLSLLGASAVLVALRVAGWPAVGPGGYWPRWAFIGGAWLFLAAMLRSLPPMSSRRAVRVASGLAVAGMTAVFIATGLEVVWYHRPLERLREIEPGRIYISAMPHGKGLEVAHDRHRFKTIINLFQEDLPGLRSPHLDDELAFAESHGIHYVRSPASAIEAEAFLDETLRLATDPDAWPVLVHCHGCMDRTPAWWGIYQFVVQGRPLVEVMRSIEQHRGSRPKASVTLLYNRVLADRAPGRYRDDSTAAVLRENARGTADPFYRQLEEERRLARDTEGDGPHRE